MLYSANTLKGYDIQASDGQIGEIEEYYFDDGAWYIRYLVVDVGNWLKHQRVLLAPEAVSAVDLNDGNIAVALSKDEVSNSPDALQENTVSRQMEIALHRHYSWTPYWNVDPVGTAAFGHGANTIVRTLSDGVKADVDMAHDDTVVASREAMERADEIAEESDLVVAELRPSGRLRSTLEVKGYHIRATDGEIGHVADYLLDTTLGHIRYLVIDTSNLLGGKKVVIPPHFVRAINWDGSTVDVSLSKEQLENSPEYDSQLAAHMGGELETKLRSYYEKVF